MTSSPPPVLIVGAGPSGLVAALTLLQNGISVRIIEKESKQRIGQRGSGIQPRSLELFGYLGVLEDIQAQGSRTPLIRKYEPGSQKPFKTWAIEPWLEPLPDRPDRNGLAVSQSVTEAILRSHIEKYSCHVELATRLQSFEQKSDHVVAQLVKTTDDGQEVPETLSVKFLLGSDGARGVVRKMLGLTFVGQTCEEELIVTGDIYITGLDRQYWHFWGDASTILVNLRPVSIKNDDMAVFTFQILGKQVDRLRLLSDPKEVVDILRTVTERTDLIYGDLIWFSDFRPNMRMVNKFGAGRVFVIGDAAHVHSPTGGQGLNSSIQDAFNLSWKLALVLNNHVLPPKSLSLLDSYTTERLPVIAEMLSQTTAILNQTFQADKDDIKPWIRGFALKQFGVNYRGSPIVLDERTMEDVSGSPYSNDDERICAGDRSPDAPGLIDSSGKQTRLFDMFKPWLHTVLIFGDDLAPSVLQALKQYPEKTIQALCIVPKDTPSHIDTVLEDRDGHAYTGYAVDRTRSTVVIVRPDGMIGAITFGVEGTERYFDRIFGI